MQGLAQGSPWLQTLNCSSLLIPNKPIFAGEIYGSLFVSGQDTGVRSVTEEDPSGYRAGEQIGAVPTIESIVTHCFFVSLKFEGMNFFLDPSSCPLCV